MPARWCICDATPLVEMDLAVDVIVHPDEFDKPSSTGILLKRVIPGLTLHEFDHRQRLRREDVARPGRDLWILHPSGESVPHPPPPTSSLQVLLLDGSWKQAGHLMTHVSGWGRKICLPLGGTPRYWLRSTVHAGRFSTAEALVRLLGLLGETDQERQLNNHFELHVAALLLGRGKRDQALAYLENSPIRETWPELVGRIYASRRQDA